MSTNDSPLDAITRDIVRLIENDQAKILDSVMYSYPYLIDRRDINERCWLHHAAEAGSWGCMEVLKSHGLDVNTQDIMGETPLHRALARHRHDATVWLLEQKANPNLPNAHGATATLYAAGWNDDVLQKVVANNGNADVRDRSNDGVAQWAARGQRQASQAAAAEEILQRSGRKSSP